MPNPRDSRNDLNSSHFGRCPVSGKVKWADKKTAKTQVRRLISSGKAKTDVTHYHCDHCGFYHVGTKTVYGKTASREAHRSIKQDTVNTFGKGKQVEFVGVFYKPNRFPTTHRYYGRDYQSTVVFKSDILNCGFHLTPREAAIARDKRILEIGLDVPLQILKKK
jgi:hypothetical protein